MHRFEPDRYYKTDDPALAVIGTRGTLAQWRHRGEGPPYVRFGNRVLYHGAALNEWIDKHTVQPDPVVAKRAAEATERMRREALATEAGTDA